MANLTPTKKQVSDFNNGIKYVNKVDTPSADDFNNVIESQLYSQNFAESIADTPDTSEASQVGVPSVTLINNIKNGVAYKKFKFANMKGDPGGVAPVENSQSNNTNTVPSSKLLKESSFARVYRRITDIDDTYTSTTPLISLITSMANNSVAILGTEMNTNLYPSGAPTVGLTIITKYANARNSVIFHASDGTTYKNAYNNSILAGWKQLFTADNISTTMPLSSAAASNEKVYSEKLAFDQLALKANAANPTFTGQILRRPEGDFSNSGLYGQSLIGTYFITHTVNTNVTQFAEMNISGASVRQAIDLKISSYLPADAIYDGQLMVTIDVYRLATSGNPEVNIKGTSVITPTDRFGVFYWTFDGSVIKFFYKAYTNYRYVTATVTGMSGWNLNANMFKFLSPLVDTGSTSAPSTPSGGSAGQFLHTDYTQLAPTNNPTFTGTVTVPAPTNPTDAARLQDVTGLSAGYDRVIRTQAEFETLISSPTWIGAQSVAFVGQFTLSTTDNSGVKIPATVKQIHGFNSAKITITNFKHDLSTARGGLWYDTAPTTQDYSIRDLEVSCTGSFGYGFQNCNNLSNCTGTGTGTSGYGFQNCNNLSNCTGTGTGSFGYGFQNCNNLSNCTGTGSYGFAKCNYLSNCTGTGTDGYGFIECNYLSNCTGTGTGTNGYGFAIIKYAVNCKDGGSSADMWFGTNKNIDLDTCRKTLVTADNTALNT